jgi:CIC family chloride channel protein
MFLVRHARDVMDADIMILPVEYSFDDFLREHEAEGRLRHVVIVKGDQIFGVLRVNTGLRRGLEAMKTGVTLGDIANRNFTIVVENLIVSDVIARIWRRNAFMAVVVDTRGIPHAEDVLGVITREHVANSVADGLRIYPQ